MDSRRASSRQIAAALCRCTLVGAVTVLAVACGLQKPAAVASRGPTRTPVAAACSPADLKVRIDVRAAGGAARTSYPPLHLTHRSFRHCPLCRFLLVAPAL